MSVERRAFGGAYDQKRHDEDEPRQRNQEDEAEEKVKTAFDEVVEGFSLITPAVHVFSSWLRV